jgi:hypothetical protein
MPPVFVKTGELALEPIWDRAMTVLRNALNLVVCGYSLPITDTYMQYFLKAAFGPNKNLSRVHVFDPVLSRGGPAADAMKARYSEVFSHQMRNRIHFRQDQSDFRAFVDVLSSRPGDLLFTP